MCIHLIWFFLNLQLSLFFDILLCMTTELDKEVYVDGVFKHVTVNPAALSPLMRRARLKLWEALRGTHMRAGTVSVLVISYSHIVVHVWIYNVCKYIPQ